MCPVNLGGMRLLNLDEIRERFPAPSRPSLETLRRYIRSGQIHGRKIGGSWYVSTRSLELFLEGAPSAGPDAPPTAGAVISTPEPVANTAPSHPETETT